MKIACRREPAGEGDKEGRFGAESGKSRGTATQAGGLQEEAAGQTALAEVSLLEPQLLGQAAGLSLTAPKSALPAQQGLVQSEPRSLTAPKLALEPQLDGQTGASPTAPILALPAQQGLVQSAGQEALALQQGLVQFGPHSCTAPMLALSAQQGLLQSAGQAAP